VLRLRVALVMAALVGGLAMSACEQPSAPALAPAGQRTVSIHVEGMTCNACEQKITQAIARIPGVSSCTASHTASRAEVVIDNPRISDDVLVQTITSLGYEARLLAQPSGSSSPKSAPSDS
jgi:copper chaperone CopZ